MTKVDPTYRRATAKSVMGLSAVVFAIAVLASQTASAADARRKSASKIDFNRDIRPILSDKCFHCHGPDSGSREADLRLDKEEDAKLDRGSYWVVKPGNPDESELVRRITSEDESERMPPLEIHKDLKPEEISLLKRWIAEGAAWSLPWTYLPPKLEEPATVENATWTKNTIDQFVLARLEAEELSPSPAADKATLIRRLSIDLTGLPPSPEEVTDFLADNSAEAYERLVDRLLASPHYGERMAMYWLDLVRFADTVGYHGDQEHFIAPYRDYVINAFNRNLPFNQFTKEQLAGDLLKYPTEEQIVATGYNRVLQTSHEGGVQPKEYIAIYAADRVRNVSAVWMGATVGCAQCHDHKFDPYSAKDFYSLSAFFADIDDTNHLKGGGKDQTPTVRAPELKKPSPEQKQKIAEVNKRIADLRKQRRLKDSEELTAEFNRAREQLTDIERETWATMITRSIKPRVTRILPRGNWMDDSGEIVQPAIPEFMGKLPVGDRRANRLDLAKWLTDAENGIGGLTARVMANRYWYLLFGRGISRSLDDFGGQGEAPCNPELLDALAIEYIRSGWDTKHLMKQIVMSSTYQQSSVTTDALKERDPDNSLFARQATFRYPAEVVRDSALLISGLLVDKVGGFSVRPYQPPGYYRNLNFPEREYVAHSDERQWRRGLYMHWQRQFLHPMLKAFDAPMREECTAQRARSNTPLAALVLLNDPTFVEASRAFAERILREGGTTPEAQLDFAHRQTVSRSPDASEQALLLDLLKNSQTYYADKPEEQEKLFKVGLKPIDPSLNRTQLAAWTLVARTLLGTNETLSRN